MVRARNTEVVLSYVDAFNRGDFDDLRGLFAGDALIYGVRGWGGLDVAMPVWRTLHEGLQMRLIVEDIVEAGDTVAVRYTERGRWVGPFFGSDAPTGRTYEIIAIEWFTLSDGRITRRWGARDSASQARQIGLP